MSSPRSIPTVDLIGSLPDSVLSHILSFLPTKLAVATSVLSKRWTPLWKSVTTLDVDDKSFPDFTSFRHFVYSVLVSRDATLPVQSFRIRCGRSDDFDLHDLNRFVLIAVQQGLQYFDLNLSRRSYDLKILAPTILRVLSYNTLVVLKLKNLTIYNLPHLVDLPLLKTLHLVSIYFLDFEHFMKLFNGCPILEDLHSQYVRIDHYSYDSTEEFKGFPNLVRANLRDYDLNFPFSWLYNAKFMCVELHQMLHHMQIWIREYQFPTFHNLTHMELIFNLDCGWPENWVIQVLQHCPKLQNLIIIQDDYYEEESDGGYWEEPKVVPECLSSQLRICLLRGYRGTQSELQFAEYIMLNSKLLCSMTIESNWVGEKAKHQMLKKLSSYPRGSVTCKLLFD